MDQFPAEAKLLSNQGKLSSLQYKTLLQESSYTPEVNRILKDALINKILNANIALVEILKSGSTQKSLLPIGLCLRYGANPNTYVNYPGVSEHIHILGYTYLATNGIDSAYVNMVLALLILAGSNLSKPIFDEKMGGIRSESELINYKYTTVSDWLYSRGYTIAKDYAEKGVVNVIPKHITNLLKVLLDEYTPISNELIIKSLGDNAAKAIIPSDRVELWVSTDLNAAIKYYNTSAFNRIVKAGYLPSYPMITDMILKGAELKKEGYGVLHTDIVNMLNIAIEVGIELDIHQIAILQSLDPDLMVKIKVNYEKPSWKKTCSQHVSGTPLFSVDVKRNLIGANITIDESTCGYLEKIEKTDIKELASAAKVHKMANLVADLSRADDFIGTNPSSITFNNEELIRRPPSDYGDMYEVHYMDSHGKKWIFTSELFETLTQTRLNPVSLEPLPEGTLAAISFRLRILQQLGITLSSTPASITESLAKLRESDRLLGGTSPDENYLHQLSTGVRIDKLRNMNVDEILDKLQHVNISINLKPLTPSHITTTILWMLVWLQKIKPELVRLVAGELGILEI